MSMPATKAPSASDMPKYSVTKATARQRPNTDSRNSSLERIPATRRSTRGSTHSPRTNMAPRKSTVFSAASPRAAPKPGSPMAGITTIIGTTARSCTSSMPIITRPWGVPSSPRSISSLSTTMVLESAMRKPKKTASGSDQSSASPSPSPSAAVAAICTSPPRMATRPIRRSDLSENSMPSVKRRSTTPICARTSICSTSRISSKP